MIFKFFLFCLTLSVTEKLKNSISEMPIITQTLNINNLRTTSAKSINVDTIRKLVEYCLKNLMARVTLFLSFWRYCSLKVGLYCDPPSAAQGEEVLMTKFSKQSIQKVLVSQLEELEILNLYLLISLS